MAELKIKPKHKDEEKVRAERLIILEMIDASCELAAKKGAHALERGCNCISCVNKRKRLLEKSEKNWKFKL